MTFVEKEAPMGKPANDVFDAKFFLAKVGAGKQVLEFHKNQHVFEQGDVADAVFYIQKGRVKLTVLSEQGKEAVVAILEPGQFFGEGCMNGHPLRIATTTAMENCVITSITKAAMIAALHDEPTFSEMFMAYLLTRNSRIEEDLIDQLFNSSERRLARMLLLLANFGKEGSPQPINPHVSQETLAEMVGTTRSRVSHFMNKFRKLGLKTGRSPATARSAARPLKSGGPMPQSACRPAVDPPAAQSRRPRPGSARCAIRSSDRPSPCPEYQGLDVNVSR
jgi:CRP/FNR family cyclic AMP-dependent transcriptional regulator